MIDEVKELKPMKSGIMSIVNRNMNSIRKINTEWDIPDQADRKNESSYMDLQEITK